MGGLLVIKCWWFYLVTLDENGVYMRAVILVLFFLPLYGYAELITIDCSYPNFSDQGGVVALC